MANTPVLIGPVPLLYVQRLSITEGYQIERIAGSRFSQAIAPTAKTITVEAVLPGPGRLLVKKQLEALALVSRTVVAATAPLLAVAGIPVVSGLTVSLDMQITDLRFAQSATQREALEASVTLRHVPRSSITAALGEAADLALAAATALSGPTPPAAAVPRAATAPLGG
ncbi:hypothetical protein LO762_08335 [Actinocorallia sp. API 0066]|uniref:hypothetical protein n=1 Tax=Actinocorallia sp. API 0066 TaxID=2896846 RepID=UPI001E414BC0|nr:hypothetical protein [Actinocorallia sp. API 0066]MCD0449194.1 hypothetical protein [Actinocorallia sp. API 0066]